MITTPEVSLGEMLVGYFSCSVLWHECFRILACLPLSFFLSFFEYQHPSSRFDREMPPPPVEENRKACDRERQYL